MNILLRAQPHKPSLFVAGLLLMLTMLCFSASAQVLHSVKGRTIDTASTSILVDASVAILNAKDSTLVKFARTLPNGNFQLDGIKSGKFILLISYPKYADFVDHFSLDSTQKIKDYGKINLTGLAKLLNDVVITGNRTAIKIKGDTTIFDPKAYNIEPNAKVEDLIKQFPGFQVDKDGKITAQGKSVPKVLVDGEEFFGDDPTLVTKNLRADMVESVQLYDKSSDQAAFTGIDDGEKTKTLNIKLKEDKKNGYFGKLQGGYGTDDFYTGQAMFNKFWGKKKFSAYGILANTGTVGLGWDDRDKYGGNSLNVSDEGYFYYSGGGDDFDSYNGQYNGQGIPIARTGGLHFDSKWNKDKESLNTNYKIGSFSVSGDRNTISQNNLSNGVLNNVSDQTNENSLFRQKVDATYEIKIDTTLTLKVNVDGTLKNSNTLNNFNSSSSNGNNNLLNTSTRALKNKVDEQQFDMNALFTKKLKKKGRTLSLNLRESLNKNNSNGTLNSDNKFYDSLGVARDSLINQLKVNDISNSSFVSNLAYTEPLSKTFTVIVNYGLSLMNGQSDRKSFNKGQGGNYSVLDTVFSNNYQLDQVINQGGAIFNYKKGKTVVNFGSKFSGVNFKQKDVYADKTYSRNFINYMPQASYQYRFSQQKSLRINYNGNSNQPSLDQIQPVRVNTDPLNITLGNPDLKPSFRSSLNLNYNSYKVLTNQSIYIGAYGSLTANPIVSNVTTDQKTGKSTYQSVNIGDKTPSNFSMYGGFGRKIQALDLNVYLNLDASTNSSYNFINDVLNNTQNNSYSGSLSLSQYKNKKYSFSASFGPSYNISKASVGTFGNSSGWGANGNANASVQLPGKFEISTDANYLYTGKTQTFNNSFKRLLWNAALTKKFFKSEDLKLEMKVNDLLNQNVGFDRSAYNGNITQSSYTTIKRYFLFSIMWDFNKMGGGLNAKK
ncbi:hypothetical protein ABIB40_002439 [Pedobacter sp. UYP30]|uniref:outer membrane beta-barrel family protein n=1 Tax=Pedobacter sp. UYP30 TaxID=1756400 RepID=UPI003391034B